MKTYLNSFICFERNEGGPAEGGRGGYFGYLFIIHCVVHFVGS